MPEGNDPSHPLELHGHSTPIGRLRRSTRNERPRREKLRFPRPPRGSFLFRVGLRVFPLSRNLLHVAENARETVGRSFEAATSPQWLKRFGRRRHALGAFAVSLRCGASPVVENYPPISQIFGLGPFLRAKNVQINS